MSDALAAFTARHIGPAPDDIEKMLGVVGQPSLDALIDTAIPADIRSDSPLDIPAGDSERSVIAELRELADRNVRAVSMIGQGYYGTITPPVIARNVLENPAWYTAYTPYQPEISQGRLEALVNFQTVVSDLTGLAVSGASLLDEATAAAEAVTLMRRSVRGATDGVLLADERIFPQTMAVVRTRADALGLPVVVADLNRAESAAALTKAAGGAEIFGVLVQYPDAHGAVRDLRALTDAAHELGALVTAATDLLALTLLTPPGEWGADIAVGSSQRFGVPMMYGGPHAGFMSVRQGLERTMPGRLVGVSVDDAGYPAYRLALQTREQHIRREKATSNICTAQVLLAVMASMYAVYHGPAGLRAIAEDVHWRAADLAAGLRAAGVEVTEDHFFDTVTVRVVGQAAELLDAAARQGFNLYLHDADHLGISVDETTTAAQVSEVLTVFGGCAASNDGESHDPSAQNETTALPEALQRTSDYLTHPTFSRYTNETAMLRYLRLLADKDFALDRGMIPLGSCTMKLNATTEMLAVTWPEFADIHPFAPPAQTEGYRELIAQLEGWLAEITGYDAVSVQPNAGSQGELAGLLAIRDYHRSRGQEHRVICLIPQSAHGTNAASAVMAGMKVVVVATAAGGDIDMADLRAKVDKHRDELAAIMVTYPSTHGVYEDTITELCELIHDAGGQVYVDGANLNALVGLARPGKFGSDVSHLNLHKTFCIPHGGGGPGVGPIGVREHLAPYLPANPVLPERQGAPVSAAPFGSAGILAISWAYIRLMGGAGLTEATRVAVLGANYVAARLGEAFPVLYTGAGGLVAHECILDVRPLTKSSGVTVDDIAKRLIDYGFHAPTMSFPVAGTLMVEPTESEDLRELDRFCEAMLAIRAEIQEIEDGSVALADSPLRRAPHTAITLAGEWERPYGRMTGAFPQGHVPQKYWPPVGRIDGAYGDRNLVCSCPPPEAFED